MEVTLLALYFKAGVFRTIPYVETLIQNKINGIKMATYFLSIPALRFTNDTIDSAHLRCLKVDYNIYFRFSMKESNRQNIFPQSILWAQITFTLDFTTKVEIYQPCTNCSKHESQTFFKMAVQSTKWIDLDN